MSRVILYIATSLDGFIARPDGNIDWLNSVPNPATGDYGYTELLESIGTMFMGRKTYDEVIGFGIEWPYPGIDTFVVTTDKNLEIKSPNTYLLTENIKDFVTELKKNAEKDIWLVGGGQLITTFINNGLLDRMIITIIPKLIGEGIPLFAENTAETVWKLIKTEPFDTGLVNLTYDKAE
ncbi:dihydrofolate reductase family protein [Chitinophagaceae bacterium LB-8]|uniref:Dihydrofolate reductase family protein n=1 Tax=Paraflavisolibacter caeni TaxID=2982496 RepID=A0A9X2XYA4_9BACT|nr:dihydrofolate reductase family protein [Paraflavisolibacter caeni]MCU7551430.1 dihydrofolate reductase family protein [Paraflavisolibacter caeni]